MAKAKLRINSNDRKALTNASDFTGVELGDEKVLGSHSSIEVTFKNPVQLFELGQAFSEASNGSEVKTFEAPKVSEAKEAKISDPKK